MSKTFIIAELSANHGHKLEVALESVRAAKEVGADAVKIQTYTADTITLNCDADDFKVKGTLWNGRTLYDLYQEAYTPWEWHQAIFDEAKKCGLICSCNTIISALRISSSSCSSLSNNSFI